MLLLYVLLVLFMLTIRRMVNWRVRRLERAYVRITGAAESALEQTRYRPGNGNRPDPYVAARQQYEVGRLAVQRDQVESRYMRWQRGLERLTHWVKSLREWRGRMAPYAVGVLDLASGLVVLEMLCSDMGTSWLIRELIAMVIG